MQIECKSEFAEAHFWKVLLQEEDFFSEIGQLPYHSDLNVSIQSKAFGSIDLEVKQCSFFGKSYMSDTYFFTATTLSKQIYRAFGKVLPLNPVSRENAQELHTHDREVAVYRHLFPALQEKGKQIGLGDNQVVLKVPLSYYLRIKDGAKGKTESSVLIMEDLKWRGFQQQHATEGFDYQHCKVALTTLAQYHALSIVYMRHIRNNDGHFNLPEQLHFVREASEFDQLVNDTLHNDVPYFMEYFKSSGFREIAEWFEAFRAHKFEATTKRDDLKCGYPLICITHGDFHSNNIMFRYENSVPVEIKMIDWQLSVIGHPGRDVAFFFYSCTSGDVRKKFLNQLLNDYFDALKESLHLLKVDLDEICSRQQFMSDMKTMFLWAMFRSFFFLWLFLDDSTAKGLEEWKDSEGETSQTENSAELKFLQLIRKKGDLIKRALPENAVLRNRLLEILFEMKAFDTS